MAGCAEFNQSLLASPVNPVNGATTNTAANVVQRVPYAGIEPGSYVCQSAYTSNYNSLQASLTKRMSHGLQLQGSYTWSRTLDETSGSSGSQVFELWLLTNDQRNPRQGYGPTDFDRTHRLVFSFNYDLPAIRSMGSLIHLAASGWQASGIFVAQGGTPITVLDYNAGVVYGNYPFENRAQLSGARIATHGSLYSRASTGISIRLDSNPRRKRRTAPALETLTSETAAWELFADQGSATWTWPPKRRSALRNRRAFTFAWSSST